MVSRGSGGRQEEEREEILFLLFRERSKRQK